MAGERQNKTDVQSDPFAALLTNYLSPGQVTTTTGNAAGIGGLQDVLNAQQNAYNGGNADLQNAIVANYMNQANAQNAQLSSKSRGTGGYNSAANQVAQSRVSAAAANAAAEKVGSMNATERANASNTAANLSRASSTQTIGVDKSINAAAAAAKYAAITGLTKSVPGLIDAAKVGLKSVFSSEPTNWGALAKATAPVAGFLAGGPVGLAGVGLVSSLMDAFSTDETKKSKATLSKEDVAAVTQAASMATQAPAMDVASQLGFNSNSANSISAMNNGQATSTNALDAAMAGMGDYASTFGFEDYASPSLTNSGSGNDSGGWGGGSNDATSGPNSGNVSHDASNDSNSGRSDSADGNDGGADGGGDGSDGSDSGGW